MATYAEWHNEELELDDTEYEALVDYLGNQHEKETDEYDDDTVRQCFEAYQGQWESMEDYVEQLVRETRDIPEWVKNHIDWESMAHDYHHDYWISDNGHVYSSY
jgi:flagellum-specific peptidoglycan hydrolase FlgJ